MALLPKPPATPMDQFGHKFEHLLAFAVLTSIASLGWPHSKRWRMFLLLAAFGAMIEVIQKLPMLHRDSDWFDLVPDTLAIILAFVIVTPIQRALRADRAAYLIPVDETTG